MRDHIHSLRGGVKAGVEARDEAEKRLREQNEELMRLRVEATFRGGETATQSGAVKKLAEENRKLELKVSMNEDHILRLQQENGALQQRLADALDTDRHDDKDEDELRELVKQQTEAIDELIKENEASSEENENLVRGVRVRSARILIISLMFVSCSCLSLSHGCLFLMFISFSWSLEYYEKSDTNARTQVRLVAHLKQSQLTAVTNNNTTMDPIQVDAAEKTILRANLDKQKSALSELVDFRNRAVEHIESQSSLIELLRSKGTWCSPHVYLFLMVSAIKSTLSLKSEEYNSNVTKY